jgi:hypothetical protein
LGLHDNLSDRFGDVGKVQEIAGGFVIGSMLLKKSLMIPASPSI